MKTRVLSIGIVLSSMIVSAQSKSIQDSIVLNAIDSMINEYDLRTKKNSCVKIQLIAFRENVKFEPTGDSLTYLSKDAPEYTLLLYAMQGTSGIKMNRVTSILLVKGIPVIFESGDSYFTGVDTQRQDKLKKQLVSYVKFSPGNFFAMWRLEVGSEHARITKETWPKK